MSSNSSNLPTVQPMAAADVQTLGDAVQTIRTIVGKYDVEMSAAQRRSAAKLNPKTVDLASKTGGYMQTDPQFIPPFVKIEDYVAMVASLDAVRSLLQPLKLVTQVLDDIAMLTGCQVYSMTLSYYQSVKQAAKAGEYNAAKIYADLSSCFPGRPTKLAAAAAQAVIESAKDKTSA